MRRGATTMTYEVIISLILLALFTVATFGYITAKADGSTYFSRFYSADLATSADIVNSGAGNVILRYDNLKNNVDLTYQFSDGIITVMPAGKPTVAVKQFYGKSGNYQGIKEINAPSYLVLRKINKGFAISDVEQVITACPAAPKTPSPENARISIQASQGITSAFAESLKNTPLTVTGQNPNIIIEVSRTAGTSNAVRIAPTNVQGKAVSCHFIQQLAALSLLSYSINEPQSAPAFSLKITITTADTISDEQIGRALALALVRFYA
jgi:hypothetical protein